MSSHSAAPSQATCWSDLQAIGHVLAPPTISANPLSTIAATARSIGDAVKKLLGLPVVSALSLAKIPPGVLYSTLDYFHRQITGVCFGKSPNKGDKHQENH